MPMIPISRDGSNGDITPSDTTELNYDLIFVGTGGDVAIEYRSGNQQIMKNIANGAYLPDSVKKVLATGTTATNIVGKYLNENN